VTGVVTRGALPRLRGRGYPLERCLACEAEGIPWSVALLATPQRLSTNHFSFHLSPFTLRTRATPFRIQSFGKCTYLIIERPP
jgi:hypothetical protein